MRKSTLLQLLLPILLFPAVIIAQEKSIIKKIRQIKESGEVFAESDISFRTLTINKSQIVAFKDPNAVSRLQLNRATTRVKNKNILLRIPAGSKSLELQLMEVPESFYNYSVVTSDGKRLSPNRNNKHYRGIIANDSNSIVALTITENEIYGIISGKDGNYNLGKIKGSEDYLFYNENNLVAKNPFNCATSDDAPGPAAKSFTPPYIPGFNTYLNCTGLYFETEYDMFTTLGSIGNVENFVTSIYNQVATLYENEAIPTRLTEIYVWTSTDPYTSLSTSGSLAEFQAERTSFNGDLGQLLTFRNVGGGIAAGFDGLCNPDVAERLSFSGINNSVENVPTFSWTVFVVTHEFGHLFGSRHTHACVWNGNNTAIDGCSGATEGGCPLPANPSQGTIMSYCYQVTGVGINFSLGFGPQPGAAIRASVLSCIGGVDMNGAELLCSSESYALTSIPSGASVSWSVIPTGKATISGSGSSVTLTRSGSARGEVILRATFIGGCPDTGNLEKRIWVGEPDLPVVTDEFGDPVTTLQTCAGIPASVFAQSNVNDHVTNYAWQKGVGLFTMSASGNMATVSHPSAASGAIDVRAQNACGYSQRKLISIQILDCFAAAGSVKVYPNPASQQLRVTAEKTVLSAGDGAVTAELYNLQGQQLKRGALINGQIEFKTGDLPDGIYILLIRSGKQMIRQRVMVRHK